VILQRWPTQNPFRLADPLELAGLEPPAARPFGNHSVTDRILPGSARPAGLHVCALSLYCVLSSTCNMARCLH